LPSLFHPSAPGRAATERTLDTLDQAPAAPRPAVDGRQRPPPEGGWPAGGVAVGGCSVTVRYPGRAVAALERGELELEAGELVAVGGGRGAGKNTLGRVVLGLTRPDEGVVVAGGRELGEGDLDRWRERVGWASQHPALVPGAGAANLALGGPGAGPAQIEEAARLAGADGFVRRLPAGYGTVVGAGGHGLSAGARQPP